MASAGAYPCPNCDGLIVVGLDLTKPEYAHYVHVCKPERVAEKRHTDDPRAEFPPELT